MAKLPAVACTLCLRQVQEPQDPTCEAFETQSTAPRVKLVVCILDGTARCLSHDCCRRLSSWRYQGALCSLHVASTCVCEDYIAKAEVVCG